MIRDRLAPIALFVYNRPEHTKETLEALSECKLSDSSTLYVFCDGPKKGASRSDIRNIERVRKIVKSKKWCKKVVVTEKKTNKGLAKSILDGVTKIINKHGKIIVLEDDIVPMEGFLEYMNNALDIYSEEPKVMQVSAYVVPYKGLTLPETFFYSHASSWGWATWKRVWDNLEISDKKLLETIKKKGRIHEFDLDDNYEFSSHLQLNIDGKIKTWAIKLVATIFNHRGLCLYPFRPIVKNIGFDGTGVHSGVDATYINKPVDYIEVNKLPTQLNHKALKKIKNFYAYRKRYYLRQQRESILLKLKRRLKSMTKIFLKIFK